MKPFTFPREPSAWWAFLSGSLGGLLLLWQRSQGKLIYACLLVVAAFCLFLASDWISSLSGKGMQGDLPPSPGNSLFGWSLVLGSVICLTMFYYSYPPEGFGFWTLTLTALVALVGLMFLLRLEMVPMDVRLLFLSSLLCTLPALFLGFMALGNNRLAWLFWALPAVYFPASSVFTQSWLKGAIMGRPPFAQITLPLLALAVAAVAADHWWQAALLAVYILWLVRQLLQRINSDGEQLPAFSEIFRFGRRQALWNALLVSAWLWTWLYKAGSP